jgi:hypothetical protein
MRLLVGALGLQASPPPSRLESWAPMAHCLKPTRRAAPASIGSGTSTYAGPGRPLCPRQERPGRAPPPPWIDLIEGLGPRFLHRSPHPSRKRRQKLECGSHHSCRRRYPRPLASPRRRGGPHLPRRPLPGGTVQPRCRCGRSRHRLPDRFHPRRPRRHCLVPSADTSISTDLRGAFERKGIRVHTQTLVEELQRREGSWRPLPHRLGGRPQRRRRHIPSPSVGSGPSPTAAPTDSASSSSTVASTRFLEPM